MDTNQNFDISSLSFSDSDDPHVHRLRHMSAGFRRPQSVADFQRGSTFSGASSIHVNPSRTRTPRTFSVSSQSSQMGGDVTASGSMTSDLDQSSLESEKTPLLRRNLDKNSVSTRPPKRLFEGRSLRDLIKLLRQNMARELTWSNWRNLLKLLKTLVLFSITLLCCIVIMSSGEEQEVDRLMVLPRNKTVLLQNNICSHEQPNIRLKLFGPFLAGDVSNDSDTLVMFQLTREFKFNVSINATALRAGDQVEIIKDLNCRGEIPGNLTALSDVQLPVAWYTRQLSWQLENKVVYAFMVLGFVYILIIFEVVHRTLAAMLGALAAIAVLSSMNERPPLEVMMGWIDMETLSLLFGMMIIVVIFSDTGFFDYSAVTAYKLAKGKIWPLITLLCIFSAVVSSFIDNVTTILLLTPVTIRLCEVLNLDPRRVLIAEVLFSNIGGTATAIGDPPNVIIVGALSEKGITFSTLTSHMYPGILLVSLAGYALLRFYYRNVNELKNKDPPDIAEMKHEVAMWRRAATRAQNVTKEEMLMRVLFLQKAVEIEHQLNRAIRRHENVDFKDMIGKLEKQHKVKDVWLLVKSGLVLVVVIILLFMYSFVSAIHLDIGWIAIVGALWLLVLADIQDMDAILHKVEWSTLIFFAALFILMEALAELGMIAAISDVTESIILSVDKESRLALAIIVIIWISAIASSFIDNIPFTTAMVPVIQHLSDDPNVDLPLIPLVSALAFGACLGGNGTLIGASCNVVCAGIAEQHGYGFSFWEFFKIGFSMMLVTTLTSTVYVLICHCVIGWNFV
ncbi:P protein-like [Physella acuta]|uniref:P protein-like n=1 Tax=Physella acuta TaxID=109671 RepID=UPI0027DBCA21|nr:P protein-like [Physella acuta]